MCRAMFGAAYYDGNEIDGCPCIEGATWDGMTCVSDLDIVIDTLNFTLEADGESSKEIKAWVENSNGEVVNVPMWIKLQTPQELTYNFVLPEIRKIDNYQPKFIKVVQAAPQINESDILYNIITAIENDNVESLEKYLKELDQVRESNTIARQNNVEYINDYTSYLSENNLENANETIVANNNLDFQSEMINLRLVALVNDPSEENINNFLKYVDELAQAEEKLKQANLSIYEKIENLDKVELSDKQVENTDLTASDWWGLLAILNFIIGIILSVVMFKKKGKKAGFITLAVMMSLTLLLLFLTGWTYNNEII